MLQKVTRLDSVPTAEETVLTTEVPTKESRLYTLLKECHFAYEECDYESDISLLRVYMLHVYYKYFYL